MSELDQTVVPRSFVDLFAVPGRLRLREPAAVVAQRHELCEDLAQMLTDTARARLHELGVAESDVLERVHRGLLADASPVDAAEAGWIVVRLAELLGWPHPALPAR